MADKLTETVERDIAGESVCGFRVAAYRETQPEHVDQYGHIYSEHWSTPNTRDPRVKVERLFTEDQLRAALSRPNVDETAALTHLEAEARRFAGFYPDGADGRNTFVIFADKIAALRGSADNG